MTKFLFLIVGTIFSFALLHGDSVEVSTATGNRIEYMNRDETILIEGNAQLISSTATIKADRIRAHLKEKSAIAQGHVEVIQSSGTLKGDSAEYNWEASTGVIREAVGESGAFRFSAHEMNQLGPDYFLLKNGDFTSCDADPPHYHLRADNGNVIPGNRIRLWNTRFVADELPLFWTPLYSKSLKPKKYTLRIEPGQTTRDGITNKTIVGYPFTPNSRTKFRWDYLERTGNGGGIQHDYFAPAIKGSLDTYYIRDINPDPQPQSRRYSALWNHYQKLSSRLTVNAKFDYKSDQTFGNQFQNVGNDVRIENTVRGMFSEGGFNYQMSKASLQMQFDRRDRFDSTVSSDSFISKVTLPRLSVNTVPLKFRLFPFYTSFSGNYVNETLIRVSPTQSLQYQRSGDLGFQIRRDFRVNRNLTATPLAGFNQFWQDRDLSLRDSEKDVYISRTTMGTDLRQRFRRSTNLNVNYRYVTRSRKNQLQSDNLANDYGVETNQVATSIEKWIGFQNRLTLSSGYDLRKSPRNFSGKYAHRSERYTPPSLDLYWVLRRNIAVSFRETYGLFNSQTQESIRTPINTSGEIQVGQISQNTYFSQGFSYTKNFFGPTSQVIFTNRLKCYVSPKWYLDGFLSYRAEGPGGVRYKKVFPIERTIQVVRDMHCWVLRMKFSNRPGVSEASFFIDLKTNLATERDLFGSHPDGTFYKSRVEELDVSQIFPDSKPE